MSLLCVFTAGRCSIRLRPPARESRHAVGNYCCHGRGRVPVSLSRSLYPAFGLNVFRVVVDGASGALCFESLYCVCIFIFLFLRSVEFTAMRIIVVCHSFCRSVAARPWRWFNSDRPDCLGVADRFRLWSFDILLIV